MFASLCVIMCMRVYVCLALPSYVAEGEFGGLTTTSDGFDDSPTQAVGILDKTLGRRDANGPQRVHLRSWSE